MPTKKVNYKKDKAVIVRVYTEKPRNNRKKSNSSSSSLVQEHHHHVHYHIHQTLRKEVIHNHGYDRRAGLLRYSHLLRESSKGGASSSSSSSSTPLISMFANNNSLQPTPIQMANSKKKPKYGGRSGCFGNWKLLIPSCLRPWPNAPKKKKKKKKVNDVFSGNGMRTLQVRIRSLIPNVFSRSRKGA